MKKLMLIGLTVLLASGCADRSTMNQAELVDDLLLPPGAQNIKLLNPPRGSWHTFELDVEGQKVRILRHYMGGDAGTETSVVIPQR